jgi:DNA polymerase III gamma/tau subunit
MPLEKRQREWPAIGNDQAIEFLDRSLASGNISQTYIFIGPEDLGKSTIALAFAAISRAGKVDSIAISIFWKPR